MAEEDIKIVMFCCNWCSYGGADTAGTARMQYPPNVRVIRVMCSGRVEPQFILKAFREGADGVVVAGCHFGDCHYDAGNYKMARRMELVYRLVEELGIGKERLYHDYISASEGEKFAETVKMMVDRIKALGPSPVKEQLAAEA
ncbi:MAG TPA: hydrogenase iron-sulfur subunit [Methanothermobacter sp.]|jgi:F420-non-reducing hydrogenase iron-sulfur subunit|uniref:Methyl-viologen-reducing hydrogenase subunit delta n=1 Tax=Methanothermobacter tenebrarum TaxID=680118 RepID=A0ABN6PDX5_9EURY|nr:hydrogenase iron-sulfur subunit [Methanothermobacter tenebrarum]MDD3454121.1 hydrogenase iron-sulfur subunit [Methanobacteriales archaeon]MDI6882259.1 hydrogenase iron-sulfur subunit [Methanothermobacter sp.]MDX9693710.1 hydrogenase iron-sulfur subunit [Methanothermobacter sp.]BDH78903.1 methyl-viologen-reducing hydrogenase subunit delta [Methanothermobacter tenebrarum]HHW17110.1 hydrogenase iron-sulfur subunit [Methanothermobacter sp.]